MHAFDDPAIVAGQGTCGRELDLDGPAVDTVLVGVGGGGLCAGTAAWFADRARVVAVEPVTSQAYAAALAAGGPVEVEVSGVASDSLGARRTGAVPWAVMSAQGVGSVLVTDEAIRDAQRRLWAAVRVGAEPGGAAALAALTQPRLRPGAGRAGRRDRQRRELRPRESRVTKRFFGRPTDQVESSTCVPHRRRTMSETNGSTTETRTEKATFGAGCFWQVEENFRAVDGVVDTAVGYEGGHVDNPTYEQVCSGNTGHVEVTQVEFDPSRVSYEDLVQKYFDIHDPTQLNRQGPDVGWQYRSVIFTEDAEQAKVAREVLERNRERFRGEIVTGSSPRQPFWRAEEYHQCYLDKRRSAGGLLSMLLGR